MSGDVGAIPKRIMITGGLGTLGYPLFERLSADGGDLDILLVDQYHSGDRNTVRADVGDYRQIEKQIDYFRPEVVYHLAAEFGRENGEHYYEQCWHSNVVGTRNILELQKIYNFNLIFASSLEIYGDCDAEFLHEDYTDSNPVFHGNDYAMTKWVNEQQIRNFRERYGNRVMVLRFFNAYGPGEFYHPYRSVVCKFIHECLTGGEVTLYEGYHRVFMYIDDFIDTLAACHDRFTETTINIGGSEYVSVEEMLDIVIEHAGAPSKITRFSSEQLNIRNKRPNISRAVKILGHDPSTTLEEGIPLTVEWMSDDLGIL